MREKLLGLIERNCKIDVSDLAKMLGVTEANIVEELEKLEKEGIICGYLTLINWEKTSKEKVTGLIEVRVTPQRENGFDKIAERIYNYPEVKSVYLISGAYDLLVTLEEDTLKGIASFVSEKLSTIDEVISTATHFILKKYKDHGVVFDNNLKTERETVTL
ncbi:MAG: Lrp/AsnC family transcriptional regulator [Lachnospiraceae bacterium]|nr:Lrp/AsnC family transcriptional regulator [Lachnospiraceae bacterium]